MGGDCNFNSDLCTWSNDDHATMEWILHRGPTTTGGTGPLSDHTSIDIPGNLKAGKYIYIESSGKKQGDYARLLSESFHNKANRCLTFWYHMYGKPGSLRVGVITNQSQPVTLFNITGDHGNNWLEGSVYIPDTFREFQVVFDGIRGSSYLGDIALDDIKFTGNCNAKHSSLDATTYKTTYPLTTISSLETTTAAKATSPDDTTSSSLETTTTARATVTSPDDTTTLSVLETAPAAKTSSPDDTTISSLLETTTSPDDKTTSSHLATTTAAKTTSLDDKTTYKTHRVTTEQLISTLETITFTRKVAGTAVNYLMIFFKK
ncbi:unnamed protein product [Mytilus coruscus]|uniref:MAM domain-containing protein n=1 Tax=Mytilus coruscus TaxID=42192 RepID=A0A6J8AZ75_MYTCO|nr:unnamed protein product [Mytilus coruscus]